MNEPERLQIKRVGMVVETVDGELFTVFSRSPGTGMTINRKAAPAPPWSLTETLMFDPPEVKLDVNFEDMSSWVTTMYDQRGQRALLDNIQKGLHL